MFRTMDARWGVRGSAAKQTRNWLDYKTDGVFLTLRVSKFYGDRMTEKEIDREVQRRLAIFSHAEEVTGNVAMTCRYYGITRRASTPGSGATRSSARMVSPRSSAKVSPNATHVDVVGKIIYLRKNYHFGPGKIAMYLALPRRRDLPIGDLADPQEARHEPAPDVTALQAATTGAGSATRSNSLVTRCRST